MKMLAVTLLLVSLIGAGCGGPSTETTRKEPIIWVGMEFTVTDKILKDFGARETVMELVPSKSPNGTYTKMACYDLGKNPAIVVNYDQAGGKNIIQQLNLYYEYENKADPKNRWLTVQEIDLNNLAP